MGGPQAGIAVGARRLVEKLRVNALRRALRCDKLTLAALEATLRIYLRVGAITAEIPTLRLLSRTMGELELVAERGRDILAQRLGGGFHLEVVPSAAEIGSGAQPTEEIPSRAIRVTHHELAPEAIAAMFRAARPPIIGRIREDAFLLDVRAVDDASAFAVLFPAAPPRT
jgi:L-seryl-tRNA(Ser) seleniumtransferase